MPNLGVMSKPQFELLARALGAISPVPPSASVANCCGANSYNVPRKSIGGYFGNQWNENGFLFKKIPNKNKLNITEIPEHREWFIIPDATEHVLVDWSPAK